MFDHYTAGPKVRKSALEKFGDKLDRIGIKRPDSLGDAISRESWVVPPADLTDLAEKVSAAKTETELRKAAEALATAEARNAGLESETVKYAISRAVHAAKQDLYSDVPDLLNEIRDRFLDVAGKFTEQYSRFPKDLSEPAYRLTAEQTNSLREGHTLAAQLIELADIFAAAHNLSGSDFQPIRHMGNAQGSLLAALVFGDYGNDYPGIKANNAAKSIHASRGRQQGPMAPYQPFAAVLAAGGTLVLRTKAEANRYRESVFTTD